MTTDPLGRGTEGDTAWAGFAQAADAVVRHLQAVRPMDLWMVTRVTDDDQLVVASTGPWRDLVSPGLVVPWSASFCLRMVGRGPIAVPDVSTSALLGPVAVGRLAPVRAYLGAPLVLSDETVLGSLCAFAGTAQVPDPPTVLTTVRLLARLLGTVASGERAAAERSADAAAAYALAERDRLTGLRNRRGWDAALTAEEERARRYGSATSVVVVDLDDLKLLNDRRGHASGDAALALCGTVLSATGRPGDVVARTGGDEFGLLAVECGAASAAALGHRIREAAATEGVRASVGWATRRHGEDLPSTWRRADVAMYRDKARRRRGRTIHGAPGRAG